MLLLPALPYGTETNQMRFPMAMNLNPTTLARVITDLVDSLAAHGIMRCLILNGHGGNDLKWVLRELHRSNAGASFSLQLVQDRIGRLLDDLPGEGRPRRRDGDEHGAGAFPATWSRSSGRMPGRSGRRRFEAINRGWVEITRPWHLLTTNSGAGDPRAATAAKGEALTDLVAERIGDVSRRAGRQPPGRDLPILNRSGASARQKRYIYKAVDQDV